MASLASIATSGNSLNACLDLPIILEASLPSLYCCLLSDNRPPATRPSRYNLSDSKSNNISISAFVNLAISEAGILANILSISPKDKPSNPSMPHFSSCISSNIFLSISVNVSSSSSDILLKIVSTSSLSLALDFFLPLPSNLETTLPSLYFCLSSSNIPAASNLPLVISRCISSSSSYSSSSNIPAASNLPLVIAWCISSYSSCSLSSNFFNNLLPCVPKRIFFILGVSLLFLLLCGILFLLCSAYIKCKPI